MYIIIMFALMTLLTVGCREGTPLSEKGADENPVYMTEVRLGQAYLDQVNNANRIVLSKVSESPPKGYALDENTVELSEHDIAALKDILLDDKSYLFDVRKRCVFIPEYALEFYVKGEKLLLLYAPLCKEFKIPYGQFKSQIIEIDPSFEQIENLLNKYKKQLEVFNDENDTSTNG